MLRKVDVEDGIALRAEDERNRQMDATTADIITVMKCFATVDAYTVASRIGSCVEIQHIWEKTVSKSATNSPSLLKG